MPANSRRRFLFSAAVLLKPYTVRAAPQEPVFTSDVQVVNILATVRTKKGEIVADLSRDDFSLLEDGHPQQIRYFTRNSDLPLTIGLMIDTSMSQVKVLNAERGASFRFIDQVLRENKDRVFVMQFDVAVQTRQPLTGSRKALSDTLPFVDTPTRRELQQGSAGTLLYDAAIQASEDVMAKQQGRKALIFLTDGEDNGSDGTLATAIEAAHRADTLVYSILFSDSGVSGFGGRDGRGVLMRLARETGGGFFEVSKKLPIDRIFAVIEEDLRSQYSVGYVSDRPAIVAEFRRIQLAVNRAGLLVQARDRYWAGLPARAPTQDR